MIAYLKKLRGELSPEQEILRNRLVMGGAAGIGCYFFAFDAVIFSAFFAYLSLNAALYAMQKKGIWLPEKRWLAAIIMDVMMAFTVMLRAPEQMSIFYPIILWMILGNGFRYGVKWLLIAAGLSTLTFSVVVLSTDYWQQNIFLGCALTLSLLIIPAYCSTLIRKISLAKEQAELASKAKSYFLASVSHELRTPLNAIIGYGNHLRQSDMPRNQKEMVEASVLAGEHLLHLIEQLIEVAKTGAGSTQIKNSAFRPTELLTEIRDIMAVRIEDKGLSIHLQAEPLSDRLVEGPTDVLRNILLNLVGNALKFTEAGSISINGGFSSEAGKDVIWFTVSDTGIGIAEAAIERIFQPFQQADDTVLNRFGGTGLGLAICKQLVEQVDGKISATSSVGQGSTFRIEVPVNMVTAEETDWLSGTSDIVHIVSFGDIAPELLGEASSADNFILQHINCQTPEQLASILSNQRLQKYKVALMSYELARQIDPDSEIWNRFAAAEVAPVLISGERDVDVDEVALRAAFASILPASANFAELRSAIRIGCSFAPHFRTAESEVAEAPVQYSPRKILVADDNRTNRNVLRAILGSAGHEVTMVTDGDEALEALEAQAFDILLLDINMPRLNGIDACMMWRQTEGVDQHLPIVGVTADATPETEERCQAAGMDLRITKPVDAKLLLSTIDQLCNADAGTLPVFGNSSQPLAVVVPLKPDNNPVSDAIDVSQLNYLMSIGDDQFVRGMIEGFFEDAAQSLEPLRRSVHEAKVRDFRFCAHAIKSSCNNMGAKTLAEMCGRLERVTEAEFDENRFIYLENIEAELDNVLETLKPMLESYIAKTPMAAVR